MTAYLPALIWGLSAAICYSIGKSRRIKPKLISNFFVVLLGPLAIPLLFMAKRAKLIRRLW
jgi:hypothetical protein